MSEVMPCPFNVYSYVYSSYPDHRVRKDDQGQEEGVAGSVSLLQNVTVSSQPISSMDWSPDKVVHIYTLSKL